MSAPIIRVTFLLLLFFYRCQSHTVRTEDIPHYRQKVLEMFHHAYDGYIKYAYPYDELRPLTCDGHDTWGSYSLTLIDSLDMLVIMGNNSEFQRVAQLVLDHAEFDIDINVSVFETNIRVVGGLISAHLLSKRGGMDLEPGWPCSGPFLRMAENVARRLLPAFNTPTGMPYGTVNLRYGVPKGETTVTCTAGVGTFLVEFSALSKLTGDPIFEKVALKAMDSLWEARSTIDLVGNHIDVATGKWTALDSGVGGGIDSYFEYLVKGSIMLHNPRLLQMFKGYLVSVEKYLKRDDWYMFAHMTKGTISLPIFTSLDCYWPGIQSMLGDIDKAMKTIHNFHQVWKQFGFLPEFYNIVKNEAHSGREGYPLRPELVEAAMYLYQATKDPYLLEIGVDMIESIEHSTRTKCGYATIKDVNTHTLENRMESFFLAETIKYLYLLFDRDNFIHNTGDHGTKIQTPNGECIIDTGSYIFNTEGHPIDTAALYCCSAEKKEDDAELQHFHDNLDLLSLLDVHDEENTIQGVKWNSRKKREKSNTGSGILGDLKLGGSSWNSKGDRGDHQNIMSTEGKVFKMKDLNIPVINLNIKDGNVIVETIKEAIPKITKSQTVKEGIIEKDNIKMEEKQISLDPLKPEVKVKLKEIKIGKAEDLEESCDNSKPGADCKENLKELEKEKYVVQETEDEVVEENLKSVNEDEDSKTEFDVQEDTEEKYGLKLAPDMKKSENLDDDDDDDDGDWDDEDDDKKTKDNSKQQPTVQKPVISLGHHDTVRLKDGILETSVKSEVSNSGLNKLNEVIDILKSMTTDILSQSSINIRTLQDKLKYYNLFKVSNPELMTCKAQPFYMRFSTMGEMFLEDNL